MNLLRSPKYQAAEAWFRTGSKWNFKTGSNCRRSVARAIERTPGRKMKIVRVGGMNYALYPKFSLKFLLQATKETPVPEEFPLTALTIANIKLLLTMPYGFGFEHLCYATTRLTNDLCIIAKVPLNDFSKIEFEISFTLINISLGSGN